MSVRFRDALDVAVELVLPLLDDLGRDAQIAVQIPRVKRSTTSANRSWAIGVLPIRRHIANMEPSFMASPMSPLTLSLPDMKSIWPDCLPEIMSSQSWARDLQGEVRAGRGALLDRAGAVLDDGVPGATAVAAHVVLDGGVRPRRLVGAELGGHRVERFLDCRHRAPPPSSISRLASGGVTRSPAPSRGCVLEREQVHAAGHRQHGARDVARPLRARGRPPRAPRPRESPSRCMATRLTMRSYMGLRVALGPMIPGAMTLDVTL